MMGFTLPASRRHPAWLPVFLAAGLFIRPAEGNETDSARLKKCACDLVAEMPVNSVAIENLRIGQLTLSGAGSLRAIDETNPWADFDAFLGAEPLLQMDMELNLRNTQIKFCKATHCADQFLAYWEPDASSVPLRLAGYGKLPMIDVGVDGRRCEAYLYPVTLLEAQGNAQAAKVAGTAWRDACGETTASESR